jgi:tRNA-splicing ligase RtcB
MQDILKGKYTNAKLWVPAHEVESSALDQVRNVCSIPGVKEVAVMPDCHYGSGATIGTVIRTKDIIMPAPVGVDIGCGMMAIKTNFKGRDLKRKDLEKIHDGIRERVPVGFNNHESIHKKVKDMWLWDSFCQLISDVHHLKERAISQMGTLGGGNHFIELSTDQNDTLWIMLHSGSRHIGFQIALTYIKIAQKLEHNKSGLPDKALAYFEKGTPESPGCWFWKYMGDLSWAQQYAQLNRERMADLIKGFLLHLYPSMDFLFEVNCHHNYVEDSGQGGYTTDLGYITRKGAINATSGKFGIIPGAMGAKSYIVKGTGNRNALFSAPHGAGRRMSRSKAKKKYQLSDLEETMKGIVCSVNKKTVDEIKYSYKDIDRVMEYSTDLVEPVYILKQIMNIKG